MCGIIAVVRRPSRRPAPTSAEVLGCLSTADQCLADPSPDAWVAAAGTAAAAVRRADALLRGTPGVRSLLADPGLGAAVEGRLADVDTWVAATERALDVGDGPTGGALEALHAALVELKDAAWSVRHDRLRTAREVGSLAGPPPSAAAVEAYTSIQQTLSALDRLEVRGRDSAGVHVLVRGHGLDLDGPEVAALLEARGHDPLFRSGAVRRPDGLLSFVYKAAAEIGELGDNTRVLRAAIAADPLLRRAVSTDGAEAVVLGHTRWASVGIISEPNAHPLDSAELGAGGEPYVTGALNGDVDNFVDLRDAEQLRIPRDITTDAKVIPTLVSRRLAEGQPLPESFRRTVASLEGSVAIAASAAVAPADLLLALRGSGQALYVGLAEDAYIVASEPYGVVEDATRYLRMDGETPANAANPTASRGQLVLLEGAAAGTIEGIHRLAYDGTPLPVADEELQTPAITTRDIDRGGYPHFLLKEISEAPSSFRKTLRGKLVERDGRHAVELGPEVLPADLRTRLAAGAVDRVLVIGQGTAAVAGQVLAAALDDELDGRRLRVEAVAATELSGFGLRGDMSDTLVIAVSQSGTTTDTNRTVDLARSRGASVVAIVNRRGSDLTDKADGVLHTSDGRDVEMSVASTKAFYAQVAAGFLLAVAIADLVRGPGAEEPPGREELLRGLARLPDAMRRTVDRRADIAVAAGVAPTRRHWALVGNGPNRIAAQELRIKLSELCYKSVACDVTEDKKHIDLSSEPLVLVCAAGLTGSTADDVAKEVAIYRAHQALPVVIATEGEQRFGSAVHVIPVPSVHPRLGFVLSAMAGHLFGYEAALAIDAQARPLREGRAAIQEAAAQAPGGDPEVAFAAVRAPLEPLAAGFLQAVRSGAYDAALSPAAGVRLSTLLRYATGLSSLESYQLELGRVGTPDVVLNDLTDALTDAIDELTRPVDAIKHQAKTVTVGISRSDETLLRVPLVAEVLRAGAPRDALSYRSLRTLAELDPAIAAVTGFTRYGVEAEVGGAPATVHVVDQGGSALDLPPSRTATNPVLRGTKHRVASDREVIVAVGRSDGRTVLLVPEAKDGQVTGLTLLHVELRDRLEPAVARGVLQGYRNRYAALEDAVAETEPAFAEEVLGEVRVLDLLVEPVPALADRWRGRAPAS
jgi:glucosamine--fructose-6-phosphate aminotransferase (isomerizing)